MAEARTEETRKVPSAINKPIKEIRKVYEIEQYRPISNYVILEKTQLIPKEEVSEGGIVIPQTAAKENQHQIGTVLAIGPGQLLEDGTRVPPQFKVGDRVVYNPHFGRVVRPRTNLYELILPANEVLGVLEDQEE